MAADLKVASNLESINWYLGQLSIRAVESEIPKAEEFKEAALIARNSLDALICQLKQQFDLPLQNNESIEEDFE